MRTRRRPSQVRLPIPIAAIPTPSRSAAGYNFVLTAYDGDVNGGGDVDKFRMKITRTSDNVLVYDNRRGSSDDIDNADPMAIGGGSMVIHKAK